MGIYGERERLLCRRLFERERRPRECFDDRCPDLKVISESIIGGFDGYFTLIVIVVDLGPDLDLGLCHD